MTVLFMISAIAALAPVVLTGCLLRLLKERPQASLSEAANALAVVLGARRQLRGPKKPRQTGRVPPIVNLGHSVWPQRARDRADVARLVIRRVRRSARPSPPEVAAPKRVPGWLQTTALRPLRAADGVARRNVRRCRIRSADSQSTSRQILLDRTFAAEDWVEVLELVGEFVLLVEDLLDRARHIRRTLVRAAAEGRGRHRCGRRLRVRRPMLRRRCEVG